MVNKLVVFKKIIIFLLIFYFFCTQFFLFFSKSSKKYIGGDFAVFYAAATMLKTQANLYDKATNKYIKKIKEVPPNFRTGTKYLYPPAFAWFIQPFTLFNLKTASQLWFIINNILLIITIFYLIKYFKKNSINDNDIILGLVILNFYFPIQKVFRTGQIDIFLLFLLTLIFVYIIKNKAPIVSILLSIFSLIKPFYILVLFFLLLKKKFKLLISAFIVLFLFNLAFIFISGKDQNLLYYKNVLPKLITKGATGVKKENFTMKGFLSYNFGEKINPFLAKKQIKTFSQISAVLLLIFASLLILYKNNFAAKSEFLNLEFSLLIAIFFIIQNYIHLQYLIFLLVPFLNIFYHTKIEKNIIFIITSIFSFIAISFGSAIIEFSKNQIMLNWSYNFCFFGYILLIVILVYLLCLQKNILKLKIS